MNLCDPGLQMDVEALNARISKLEDQLRSGNFAMPVQAAPQAKPVYDEDSPPPIDEDQAPPDPDAPYPAPEPQPRQPQKDDTPMGFWVDLANSMRPELQPGLRAFLDPSGRIMNAVVRGDRVGLICADEFVTNMVDKPEVRELAARKASVILGRPVTVKVVNRKAERSKSKQMEQLMAFGREHSDIIKIKNN